MNIVSNFRDAVANAFLHRSVKAPLESMFSPDKFSGKWMEMASTRANGSGVGVHDFYRDNDRVNYTISYGPKRNTHVIKMNNNNGQMEWSDINNPLLKPMTLTGLFDYNMNPVNNHRNQNYAYAVMCSDPNAWILARPGYETNVNAVKHLTDVCSKMGYNVKSYHPALSDVGNDGPSDAVVIPWTMGSFPADGSGRTINVPAGKPIRFFSFDESPHTVTQAVLVKDPTAPSGIRWIPDPAANIKSPPPEVKFNRMLVLEEPGLYHFICPVNNHSKVMRLTVRVGDGKRM